MTAGSHLEFIQSEVGPFDPPTSNTPPRSKHEVDQIMRCRVMAIWNFPKCEVSRSLVGRPFILHYTDDIYSCLYVRNAARKE